MVDAPETMPFLERARRVFLALLKYATWPALVASFVFLGLWMIPAVRAWLVEHKLATEDAAVAVIGLMIPFTLGAIASLSSEVSQLRGVVKEMLISRDKDVLRGGTGAIYPLIDAELRARRKSRTPVEIDVLGYTLFSVYPALSEWIDDGVLANMTINLYCLDEEFAENSRHIRNDWAIRSKAEQANIRSLVDQHNERLRDQNVTINIRSYHHIPAIHGFAIGNGTMYISFGIWSRGEIADPQNAVFERVRGSDESFHAKSLRGLFDNWVKAAIESSATPSSADPEQEEKDALTPRPFHFS